MQLCCLEIRYFFKDMPQIALDKKSNLEYLEREVKRARRVASASFYLDSARKTTTLFAGRSAQVFAAVRAERNETKGTAQANTAAF